MNENKKKELFTKLYAHLLNIFQEKNLEIHDLISFLLTSICTTFISIGFDKEKATDMITNSINICFNDVTIVEKLKLQKEVSDEITEYFKRLNTNECDSVGDV